MNMDDVSEVADDADMTTVPYADVVAWFVLGVPLILCQMILLARGTVQGLSKSRLNTCSTYKMRCLLLLEFCFFRASADLVPWSYSKVQGEALALSCFGFDIASDMIYQDICTVRGFLCALGMLLRLSCRGFLWLGIPCKTWIWVARRVFMRCPSFPVGDPGNEEVELANLLVSRCVILILLATARGIAWCVEQPLSSVLRHHPRFRQQLCQHLPARRCVVQ